MRAWGWCGGRGQRYCTACEPNKIPHDLWLAFKCLQSFVFCSYAVWVQFICDEMSQYAIIWHTPWSRLLHLKSVVWNFYRLAAGQFTLQLNSRMMSFWFYSLSRDSRCLVRVDNAHDIHSGTTRVSKARFTVVGMAYRETFTIRSFHLTIMSSHQYSTTVEL